jgi:formate dehydrogenase major subunit
MKVAIDGTVQEVKSDELLIDLINRTGGSVPHACYHPQLGPAQTFDTCMVGVNGRLARTCATPITDGIRRRNTVSLSLRCDWQLTAVTSPSVIVKLVFR